MTNTDTFLEHAVSRHSKGLNEAAYYLANILMVLFGLAAIVYVNILLYGFNILLLIETLLFAGAAVLLFLYRGRLRLEYEYTFTNGVMDFAAVYNNNKRKELGSLKMKNIEAFGKVSGSSFQRYLSMPGIETTRWFLNRDAELYYFYFQKNGKKRMIIIEPQGEMVQGILRYLPQGVNQDR